jgi:EpsI family protein
MNWKNTIAATGIMLSAFFLLGYINSPELIIPNKPLSTFPKTIGQWEGVEKRFEAIIYEVLGVDDSFYADYTNANGKWINLYIGYYQSQREGETIHSPKNCMPGGGWNIIESTTVPLNIGGNPESRINIIKLVLQNGRQKQISYYWYHSRGRIISSEYLQKIYLVWDAVTRNRTDGSFVRLITPVDANESDTIAALEDFVRELFPILNQYIPS